MMWKIIITRGYVDTFAEKLKLIMHYEKLNISILEWNRESRREAYLCSAAADIMSYSRDAGNDK